jgi:hypothetical protein
MKTFTEWLSDNDDYNDDNESMYAAQEESAKKLKELVALYNQSGYGKMSISQKGENYTDQRDSDQFSLYINGEEITEGDLDELIKRVHQICKENGII